MVISRQEALAEGLKTYFTGVACKRGHVAERYTKSLSCVECAKMHSRTQKENRTEDERERKREQDREFARCNAEKARKRVKEWRHRNLDRHTKGVRRWQETNVEKVRSFKAAYRLNNMDYYSAKAAERRAAKKQATPLWADKKAIRAAYKEAADVTRTTGVEHHVDHIIPLAHPLVCGLHVPKNLRVVPASENWAKSNKFQPEDY